MTKTEADMQLTFNQKAELDALVNFFGGKSLLMPLWKKDPTHRALCRKGLTKWGKRIPGGTLVEHLATPKGVAVAKRFKRDWSREWSDRQSSERDVR